ncbi:MAG: cytochrome b/b6 domain-containing protein [Acidobacteriota bacterium]|nr:cytochrome b/b6 domain-containing protein [Acidobacteriota bacterium]
MPCYASAVPANPSDQPPVERHSAVVRITHWLTVIAFLALLVTGLEIVISHPRFYWGEVGNVNTPPAFTIPIASSRGTVPTGYGYVMPDQNGWSRYLHFEAAWLLVLVGFVYLVWGLWRRHFTRNILPARGQRSPGVLFAVLAHYLGRKAGQPSPPDSYNPVQRLAYLVVIFVLFPLIIWTGLAMSPAFTAAFPSTVILLGGRQTARTLHFFITGLLVAFLVVHVVMIALAGFWSRMRGMITGRSPEQEQP